MSGSGAGERRKKEEPAVGEFAARYSQPAVVNKEFK
jgi:hypothetical protein